ncbi:hypothetical protein [Vibrio astriarenae]|uniref:hypothetical protein n=1 Tax=Vibrio astriarenae TaxID=1481923 RepID=UPI00373706B1
MKEDAIHNVYDEFNKGKINISPRDRFIVDGFILNANRPFHFYYDYLVNLFLLNELGYEIEGGVYSNDSFVSEVLANKIPLSESHHCYVAPIVTNAWNSYHTQVATQMHNYYGSNKCSSNNSIDIASDSLALWYGITGQKRSWIEQVEGCVQLVRKLLDDYDSVKLFIDGWTSNTNHRSSCKEDHLIFDEIRNKLSIDDSVQVISLIDLTLEEKIQEAIDIDYFVANSGSGSMIPHMFLNKKGVIHSGVCTFKKCYGSNISLVPDDRLKYFSGKEIQHRSYSLDWRLIYNLLLGLGCKGSQMKFSGNENLFSGLNLNWNHQADLLRDVAIAFEKNGDVNTALSIMEEAHIQRPNGKWIRKKIEEYKSKLK